MVGLRPHGIADSSSLREADDTKAWTMGLYWAQYRDYLTNWSHARRVMTVEEVDNMAVFLASDKASGMTGTTVSLTMGSLDG